MVEADIRKIKEVIHAAELRKAKAQGIIEGIEEAWTAEYGECSIEKMEDKLMLLNARIAKQESRRRELLEELEGLCDWKGLEKEP